ncbi:hypothetical protein DSTSK_38440 [Desulforhabdus sp. TSK]|nr:hypothetical protein DSTSK_38440 [Desulforhabdus sp. TSK]
MPKTNIEELIEKLKCSWPSPLVARLDVDRFSGGLLHPRTMANLDSKGEGPTLLKFGRLAAYDRDELIAWLLNRLSE